jgi:hypothetical protein
LKRNIPRLAVAAAAIAAIYSQVAPASGAVTDASSSAATRSAHFQLVTAANDVQFLGEHQLSGGDYTASWRVYGGTVTVAGMSGSTVTVPSPVTSGSLSGVGVSLRAPDLKAKGGSLTQMANAYRDAGKSPAQDALAVGFTSTQAARIAAGTTAAHTVTPMTAPGTIIYSGCANYTGDAGNAYGRACDVQKMMQDNGGGDWYVGDQVTGSGNNNDWWNSLTGLAGYVSYGPNNTIVEYAPNGTTSVGNCTTVGFSLGWNGVGLNTSSQVCPGTLSPYGPPSNTVFGAHWSGCNTGALTQGVNSDDVDHSPSGAASAPNVSVAIWWNHC